LTNGLFGRESNKKITCSLVVICFLALSMSQCIAGDQKLGGDPFCYGFIAPMVRYENASFGNQVYCKTRHMINDLLREQIPVFWTSANLTASVKEINSIEDEKVMFFEKGSFIIPFTGNNNIDMKIIVIICDYNQSSEIEKNIDLKIPVYLLMEQLNIRGYVLSEVKIAQYYDFLTCGESWYSRVALKCGFLDYEFIKNSIKKLNNSAYNLLVWPGYDAYYDGPYDASLEIIIDLSSGRNTAIRKFVSKGGGFVGSCYAVNMVSRGLKPGPAYPPRKAHNPNLISIGLLSISDIVCGKGYYITKGLEQQILDTNHPVTYGVGSYLIGGYQLGGPEIVEVGEGVSVIANFKNDTELDGTPSIISNKFGDGRVVVFSPHPEVSDPDIKINLWKEGEDMTYSSKKLITNAFYYSTAQEEKEQQISESRTISFISDIWNETLDLSGLLNEQKEIFKEIEVDINKSIEDVADINNRSYKILETIEQIALKQGHFNETKKALYYDGSIYSIYCFDLIQEYLENTSATIQTIEKIYPLLENDSHFIELINNLKNDLSLKMDEIKEILSVCFIKIKKMENILKLYQDLPGQKNIMERIFKKTSHDIEIQTKSAFQDMPIGYFDSLKFLRTSWYNYEVNIVI
jgi:hypothetical protein